MCSRCGSGFCGPGGGQAPSDTRAIVAPSRRGDERGSVGAGCRRRFQPGLRVGRSERRTESVTGVLGISQTRPIPWRSRSRPPGRITNLDRARSGKGNPAVKQGFVSSVDGLRSLRLCASRLVSMPASQNSAASTTFCRKSMLRSQSFLMERLTGSRTPISASRRSMYVCTGKATPHFNLPL